MEYTTLQPIHDGDKESSTLIIDHLTTRGIAEYYLPTPLLPLLLQALEVEEHQPLIAWVALVERWLANQDAEFILGGVTCMEKKQGIIVQHTWKENDHQVEAIQVSQAVPLDADRPYLTTMEIIREIGISPFAQWMIQPENIDALGDQFFGERTWQQVKTWIQYK